MLDATWTFGDERLPERIWRNVTVQPNGCWTYARIHEATGYGYTWWQGQTMHVHKAAYLALVGPIPDGWQVDHVCHSRAVATCPGGRTCPHRPCMNPADLEAVTRKINLLRSNSPSGRNSRKSTCPVGHVYDQTNREGKRKCSQCERDAAPNYRAASLQRISNHVGTLDNLPDDEWVTLPQIAALHSRSLSAAYAWVHQGKLVRSFRADGVGVVRLGDARAIKTMRRRPWH
jgi:hypothetical protein